MCGINGIFVYGDAAPVDRSELINCRDVMQSRGPDSDGLWISSEGRAGFGHRRLAIIDLSPAGAQPMHHGSLTIVFNGEIYNYQELRDELTARGHKFVSHSDTEVMLQMFEEIGEAMLQKLRGMFALAIWDDARKRMFLARDPYGIKPLYYADDGKTVRFASQVRALIASGRVSNQFDSAGAVGFFLRGTVPEPFTMYRPIRSLPAGSYFFVEPEGAPQLVQH